MLEARFALPAPVFPIPSSLGTPQWAAVGPWEIGRGLEPGTVQAVQNSHSPFPAIFDGLDRRKYLFRRYLLNQRTPQTPSKSVAGNPDNAAPAARKAASRALLGVKEDLRTRKILVGFDGFIDEIVHPVARRMDKERYERIGGIEDFGKRILSAAGKSSNIELVPVLRKIGGNGPLFSLAAAGMGCRVTCIGLLGYPEIDDVFRPLSKSCRVWSLGEPGTTDALEFSDGKILLGKVHTLSQMNWERILDVMGEESFRRVLRESHLVACTNWTMLTEMPGVLENIIRLVPEQSGIRLFFDLADPEKRSPRELEGLFEQMRRLNQKARCILSMNLRESEQVCGVLGLEAMPVDGIPGLGEAALRLRERLGIEGVVIHSVGTASACLGGEAAAVPGPVSRSPKILTGGGDHFNGGFCAGLSVGLDLETSLYTGVGSSGWYVRHGRSPNVDDLARFLSDWAEGELPD